MIGGRNQGEAAFQGAPPISMAFMANVLGGLAHCQGRRKSEVRKAGHGFQVLEPSFSNDHHRVDRETPR